MAIDPARFGMPDATTAGVQSGTALKPYSGPMNITTNGAVIENVIINGMLTIDADNVTIRNCVIQNFSNWGIYQNEGASNVRVEYCDINGSGSTRTSGLGVGGGTNSAIIGCDIRGMVIGIQLFGASTVKDNYIHDLVDTSSNPDDRHFDGITLFGGGGNLIEHNTIFMPENNGGTAAVFIKTEFGSIDNVTVRNNLMTGNPSFSLYVEDTARGNITNVLVENNYVERGYYGYFNIVGNNPTVRNNVQWQEGVNPTPYPNAPVDHTPDAVNDSVSTPYNTPVTFDALANDTLGDTPTAVLSYDAATANGGTVSLASGKFTYVSAAGWSGTDSFVYTIRDTDGDVDSARVSVSVGAPADGRPDAVNDSVSTPYNTPVTFDALANDTLGDTPTAVLSYDAATANGGTVSLASGKFTYISAAGWSGTDSFVYTIRDTDGDVDSARISVSVGGPGPDPDPDPVSGVTVNGTSGWDWLYGGDGNDTIRGGAGNDDLFGRGGADRFDFDAISDTPSGGGNRDFIHDFAVGVDRIDLSTIDAQTWVSGNQAFAFLGEGTFGSDSSVRGLLKFHYETDGDGNANTIIEGTVNGSAGVDFQISLLGRHLLTASDFVL